MKTLIIASLLLTYAAHADTITLQPTPGIGSSQVFANVANDKALAITINATEVWIDNVRYVNVGGTYQSADGAIITYTSLLTQGLVCVRAGKGQHCTLRWTLQSGTIVR